MLNLNSLLNVALEPEMNVCMRDLHHEQRLILSDKVTTNLGVWMECLEMVDACAHRINDVEQRSFESGSMKRVVGEEMSHSRVRSGT
ncbi:hypothetical protein BT69DRAFT_54607 [Atractiella rhizophila]|nr:hypothetical protein BT69DRAFT_79653 [Atractiella rhizophila]KAH8924682.1 hypothetical protein BT69DRAFT_54607 [Atractiella rhizophila]